MRSRGYTLLEMLVVVSLLGLAGSLVVPRVDQLVESVRVSFEQDDIIESIASLPYTAYKERIEFALDELPKEDGSTIPFQLPAGWRLITDHPIYYRANGVCSGGVVSLQKGSRELSFDLHPPLCRPKA